MNNPYNFNGLLGGFDPLRGQSLMGQPARMPAPSNATLSLQQRMQPQQGLLSRAGSGLSGAASGLGSGFAGAARGLGRSFTGEGSSARLSALGASLLQGPSRTPISLGPSLAQGLLAGNIAAQEAAAKQAALINAENERAMRASKEQRDIAKAEREASREQRDIAKEEREAAKVEETVVRKEAEKKFSALSSLDSIGQAETILKESPILASGIVGQVSRGIESSPAGQLDSLYVSIRAKLGFDQLQTMRENSPTGGALGQVSDTENKLLQSTVAELKTGIPQEQQLKNLEKVKQHTAAVVYGAVDKNGNAVRLDTPEKVYQLMNGELKVNIPSQATSARVITRDQLPQRKE